MNRTVRFSPEMPIEFKDRVLTLLDRCDILIPAYIHSVYFVWSPSSQEGMEAEHEQPYRCMNIHITARTFEPSGDHLRYMVHEIAHWFNQPLRDAAGKVVSQLCEDDTAESKVAAIHLAHVMEEVNSDLEQVFMRLLHGDDR